MYRRFHLVSVTTTTLPLSHQCARFSHREPQQWRFSGYLTTNNQQTDPTAEQSVEKKIVKKYVHCAVCSSRVCWWAGYSLQTLYRNKCSEWAGQVFPNSSSLLVSFFFSFFLSHNGPVRGMCGTWVCACFLTTQLNCTHPDLTASLLELWKRAGGGWEWWWKRLKNQSCKNNTDMTDGWDGCWGTFTRRTYLEPADVKSPHTSALGWAAGTGEPKSKRGAVCGEKELEKAWMVFMSCKDV